MFLFIRFERGNSVKSAKYQKHVAKLVKTFLKAFQPSTTNHPFVSCRLVGSSSTRSPGRRSECPSSFCIFYEFLRASAVCGIHNLIPRSICITNNHNLLAYESTINSKNDAETPFAVSSIKLLLFHKVDNFPIVHGFPLKQRLSLERLKCDEIIAVLRQ